MVTDNFSGLMANTIQVFGKMVIVMEMEYGLINMEIAIMVLGLEEGEKDMEFILSDVDFLLYRAVI